MIALLAALLLAMGAGAIGVPRLVQARARRQVLAARLQALRPKALVLAPVAYAPARSVGAGSTMLPAWLRVRLARADLNIALSRVVAVAVLLLALCAGMAWLRGPLPALGLLVLLLGAMVLLFNRLARRRTRALVDGLPHFLDGIRQLMTVGYAMQQAISQVAEQSPPAVLRYTRPMTIRLRNGVNVSDGLQWLADRLDLAELHMLSSAVQVNLRHGGRMGPVLQNLSNILRTRARVERELGASTAETRLSALILGLLPPAIAALILVVNPHYVLFFIDTKQGNHMLAFAAGMEVMGVLTMRHLMRLDF